METLVLNLETVDLTDAQWESLTLAEKESFPPICPDFVIELRSRSHSLKLLK